MLFNSVSFGLFFSVTFTLYWLSRRSLRLQNSILLLAGYVFYSHWDWRFSFLLAASTLIDYICGITLENARTPALRKKWLVLSVAVNLGILGTFKYFNFFVDTLHVFLDRLGVPVSPGHLRVVLPVGISFYTFQSLSYVIDIYRGQFRACRNLRDYALYVAFFPQLVAGPIQRAHGLLAQIVVPRAWRPETWPAAAQLFLWGLFKKAFIADRLALYVDAVYGNLTNHSGTTIAVATLFFAFQIYCDFSAYSDMARALAKLLGFELPLNFRAPYFAVDVSDFWKRWHISLSTWLRDYLYIPLGGNRAGAAATARNLLITMLLGGLWHGANWTFVIWGGLHGLYLIVQRQAAPLTRCWPVAFSRLCTFLAVLLAWVFFRADSASAAFDALARIPSAGPLWTDGALDSLVLGAAGILVLWAAEARNPNAPEGVEPPRSALMRWCLPYAALFAVILLGVFQGQQFIYFQF